MAATTESGQSATEQVSVSESAPILSPPSSSGGLISLPGAAGVGSCVGDSCLLPDSDD